MMTDVNYSADNDNHLKSIIVIMMMKQLFEDEDDNDDNEKIRITKITMSRIITITVVLL